MNLPELIKKPLRPVREFALRVAYGRKGIPRNVNGVTFNVTPSARFAFPSSHDPEVASLMNDSVKPGMCCWNVGANVGVHTLQMANKVGPKGSVVAFEPNPNAASLLRRHVEFNGYADTVTVVEAAVGESEGEIDFFVAGFDPMGRPQQANPLLSSTTRISVPVITLDSFLKSQSRRPDCIIMDIEGWEIGALRGGRSLLEAEPLPVLIVELHYNAWEWSGHSRQDLETLLREYRLSVKPLSGQTDPLAQYGQVLLYRAAA
jgi:FkbM family methyltransferase